MIYRLLCMAEREITQIGRKGPGSSTEVYTEYVKTMDDVKLAMIMLRIWKFRPVQSR